MGSVERRRELLAERKALGLCGCGREPVKGRRQCAVCKEIQGRSQRKKREADRGDIVLRDRTQCVECGAPAKEERARCAVCLDAAARRMRGLRAENAAKGLCGCGAKRTVGYTTCKHCRVLGRERGRRHQQNLWAKEVEAQAVRRHTLELRELLPDTAMLASEIGDLRELLGRHSPWPDVLGCRTEPEPDGLACEPDTAGMTAAQTLELVLLERERNRQYRTEADRLGNLYDRETARRLFPDLRIARRGDMLPAGK